MVTEALWYSGDVATRRVRRFAEQLPDPTPGSVFAALVGKWRELYRMKGFAERCPLAVAAVDTATTSPALREAVHRALLVWQEPLREVLAQLGVPEARAGSLAMVMISALEGALILARAHQDVEPLDAVIAELCPLLDFRGAACRCGWLIANCGRLRQAHCVGHRQGAAVDDRGG